MNQDQSRYLSYLIRLWQVNGKLGWQWRASLESPGSGKLYLFPSIDLLITFLRAQTGNQGIEDREEGSDD